MKINRVEEVQYLHNNQRIEFQCRICDVNYFYVDPQTKQRKHRYNFRKSRLKDFINYNEEKNRV